MKQSEFTRKIAKNMQISTIDAENFIKLFTHAVTTKLSSGSQVVFKTFATFYLTTRKPATRFDVGTRSIKLMPQKNIIKMKVHRSLFKILNPSAHPNETAATNSSYKINEVRLLINQSRYKDKILSNQFMQSFFGNIIKLQKTGDVVSINNLGTFYIAQSAARNGRNPRNNATILIKSRARLKFIPSDALKRAIN
jgi:DNA-binding protein HU-beta